MRRRWLAQDRAAREGRSAHEPTSDGAAARTGSVSFELLPPDARSDARFDALFDDRDAPRHVTTAPGPAGDHGPAGTRPWFAHPLPWVVAAVSVAFAGSFAVTASLEDARPLDVTTLPGGLRPLDEPPVPQWSVPVTPGASVVPAPGAVVVQDGGLTAYGVDDGAVLWRTGPLGDGTSCLPGPGERASDLVVCVTPAGWREPGARVTTVSSTTGDVLGARDVETAGRSVVPIGSTDLVRAWWRGGNVVVAREDAVSGEPRWERVLEHDGHGEGDDVVVHASRGVVDDLAPGVSAVLTEDGTPLVVDDVWTIVRLQDGRYVGNEYGRGTATVFTAAGDPAFRIRGRVLETPLSDGSAPGVILTNTFGSIVGVDAATGSQLWVLPGAGLRAVVRVDGRVVVQTDSSFRSVDARTGDEVWSVDLEEGSPWPVLTDGESLFVAEAGRGRQPGIVSVALDDGAVEWRWNPPEDTFQVLAVEGRLFLLDGDRLTAVS